MKAIVNKSGGSGGLNYKVVVDFEILPPSSTTYKSYLGGDVTEEQYKTTYVLLKLKNIGSGLDTVLIPCFQLPTSNAPISLEVYNTDSTYFDYVKLNGYTSTARSYVNLDRGNTGKIYTWYNFVEKFALVTL